MKNQNYQPNIDLAEAINVNGTPHKSRKGLFIIGGVVLLGLGLWIYSSMSSQVDGNAPRFTTQAISKGDIRLTVTATGNLEPTNEVSVGSEISGRAIEVYVDTNDVVSKGQALAQLDTSTLENQLKASRASLESAKANLSQSEATLKEAEATLARQQELQRISDGRIPSKSDLATTEAAAERAQASVLSAQAAINESEAEVETRESDLSKATIHSPTDGIVLSRSIEPGQTVAASFSTPELFVIAEDLSKMKLEVAVAEADIGRVAAGQNARFSVDAWPDRSFEAAVTKVAYGSAVTDNVVTYQTELSVSNEDLSLRPGMTATADIDVAYHQDVLLVPVAALRFTPDAADGTRAAGGRAGAQKKSFIDNLIPSRSRPSAGQAGDRDAAANETDQDAPVVWIMAEGRPRKVAVSLGLNDGRNQEVSADELSEGTLIITGKTRTVQ